MDIELHRLKIRHLITQKEAAIAEANMQSAREGWTCDWSICFHELDRQILAAIEESNRELTGGEALRSDVVVGPLSGSEQ